MFGLCIVVGLLWVFGFGVSFVFAFVIGVALIDFLLFVCWICGLTWFTVGCLQILGDFACCGCFVCWGCCFTGRWWLLIVGGA